MEQTRAYRKTRDKKKEKETDQTLESGRVLNLSYQKEEDRVFSTQREELEKELDVEEEVDVSALGAQHILPDGDEDDVEAWEPEEEVQESEDWDRSPDWMRAEEVFGRPEPIVISEGAENEWLPRPDIVVDREETLQGPRLHVQLAGRIHESRQRAFQERQRRLLEVAQYVVESQMDFFLRRGPLNPLDEADIARSLWPSENLENKKEDLSRLVANKWIRMPWGEVMRLEELCPNNADVLLEHIKAVLQQHDRVRTADDQVVVEQVIPVYSKRGVCIVSELRKGLKRGDGCSPENIKHIMGRAGIPRVARHRIAAYKSGLAWWRKPQ